MVIELAIFIGVPLAVAFLMLKPKSREAEMRKAINDSRKLLDELKRRK